MTADAIEEVIWAWWRQQIRQVARHWLRRRAWGWNWRGLVDDMESVGFCAVFACRDAGRLRQDIAEAILEAIQAWRWGARRGACRGQVVDWAFMEGLAAPDLDPLGWVLFKEDVDERQQRERDKAAAFLAARYPALYRS